MKIQSYYKYKLKILYMKINVKKLNQFLMSVGNAPAMKSFVETCVNSILTEEKLNDQQVIFLRELGLLIE